MKTLRIPIQKLNPIVLLLQLKGAQRLYALNILATIWSYRNQENGMYYSNKQLADLFYCAESTVKYIMKNIKEAGLVETTRRYNSSSIIKPSEKFYELMKEKGARRPPRKTPVTSYSSSSKEEEQIEIQNNDLSFETDPNFEKYLNTYTNQSYPKEWIQKQYETFKKIN